MTLPPPCFTAVSSVSRAVLVGAVIPALESFLSQHPAWCSVISRLKAAERVFTTTSLQAAAQTPSESEPITGQLASWLLWNTAINVSLISQIHSHSTSSANHRVITAVASRRRRRIDPTNLGLNKLLGINIWSWWRHHQAGWLNAAVGSTVKFSSQRWNSDELKLLQGN